jgi:polyhydroxyalkanoate synthase subunit PhaC
VRERRSTWRWPPRRSRATDAGSRDVVRLVGSKDKEEWVLKGGHVSLVAGIAAVTRTWPRLVSWLAPRSV